MSLFNLHTIEKPCDHIESVLHDEGQVRLIFYIERRIALEPRIDSLSHLKRHIGVLLAVSKLHGQRRPYILQLESRITYKDPSVLHECFRPLSVMLSVKA